MRHISAQPLETDDQDAALRRTNSVAFFKPNEVKERRLNISSNNFVVEDSSDLTSQIVAGSTFSLLRQKKGAAAAVKALTLKNDIQSLIHEFH